MFLRFIFLVLIPLMSYANLELAPPNFQFELNKRAVFIDILDKAVEFHINGNLISAKARLTFMTNSDGYPLFDLVPDDISKVKINGQETTQKLINLPEVNVATMRVVETKIKKGIEHNLEVEYLLSPQNTPELLDEKNELNFVFRFCDGKGIRQLLERYIPTNLQFDQFPLNLKIINNQKNINFDFISNGKVISQNDNEINLSFPSFFNSASFFLHIFKKNRYQTFTRTINGIKVHSYFDRFNKLYAKKFFRNRLYHNIRTMMDDFVVDYGKLHLKDIYVYLGEDFSGIEHYGAMRTSRYSLRHEILHMYFGRGVMPADGRSAWIDEGIARWSDGGAYNEIKRWFKVNRYNNYVELPDHYQGVLNQSVYQRSTWDFHSNRDPYFEGEILFGHIDYLIDGRLREFLGNFYKKYNQKLYNQEIFFCDLLDFVKKMKSPNFDKIENLVNIYL